MDPSNPEDLEIGRKECEGQNEGIRPVAECQKINNCKFSMDLPFAQTHQQNCLNLQNGNPTLPISI